MTDSPRISQIEAAKLHPEDALLPDLVGLANLDAQARRAIVNDAAGLVRKIRSSANPGLMETFLAEYGLSSDEGIALMCLAEALLRVPDARTIEDLIEDKVVPADWGRHLGKSASSLVNASTWALMLTGKILDEKRPSMAVHLRSAVKRLGEPVIRTAIARAMKEMGRQFILAETIGSAVERAKSAEGRGYTYSYDMLGEAALTRADAERYRQRYREAIDVIAGRCTGNDMRKNPGISIKLSALHPRYEVAKTDRVMAELVPVVQGLCRQAASAGMGLSIDAEEADRLGLSLQVIQAVMQDPALDTWGGFGIVVQAYGRRAGKVLDWTYALAKSLDRKIAVRLVKGAYWDTEIKHAQVEGLEDFPVFTRKPYTDISYIANARKSLAMTDRIYPQFATHNAHTMTAILHMAAGMPGDQFEFQRLHGMGEQLHDIVLQENQTRCRIYAPVGAHRDLLAYLVRRLLENGANSSFVHQIVDQNVPAESVVACPFEAIERPAPVKLAKGPELFLPERRNSAGFDLHSPVELARIDAARQACVAGMAKPKAAPRSAPLLAVPSDGNGEITSVRNPATGAAIGTVTACSRADIAAAISHAQPWVATPTQRAEILENAARLYEQDFGAIFTILAQEAGKTLPDAVGELREAVDFLRYYAAQSLKLKGDARGVFSCISPWNFPLAIFTGQIAAALAGGNGVLAKPAEQTPLIAGHAVGLLHRAGVPRSALQLLPGSGPGVGTAITSDSRISGVAFTGSTETALKIRNAMAKGMAPGAPLIAETGGINAMIVDSTALPEQAVRDILASAFQSAGQRCSALRCLYVQRDVAEPILEMLTGAMDELETGNPWHLKTDVGPVIDAGARDDIQAHIDRARAEGRLMKQLAAPQMAQGGGYFVPPALIRVGGIADIKREVFGPVLHFATFQADQIDATIDEINATGYGLTFGMHSRIDNRVQQISDGVRAGNLYVNRNQIGAVVGSQPFGGEGLSGTGPKAGGPHYLPRFARHDAPTSALADWDRPQDLEALQRELDASPYNELVSETSMPGPTGESNRLRLFTRRPLLCLGPGKALAAAQLEFIHGQKGRAVAASGKITPQDLSQLANFSGILWWGDPESARAYAQTLAQWDGPILPVLTEMPDTAHLFHERHLCIDTTAAGGNTALLMEAGQET